MAKKSACWFEEAQLFFASKFGRTIMFALAGNEDALGELMWYTAYMPDTLARERAVLMTLIERLDPP